MSTPGYSGKPLDEKLGIKPGMRVKGINVPPGIFEIYEPGFTWVEDAADMVILFTHSRAELASLATELAQRIFPDRALWVCWPKRASKVPSDIVEEDLRTELLPTGIVDVKVCAVNDTYSGLKFLWRKDRR